MDHRGLSNTTSAKCETPAQDARRILEHLERQGGAWARRARQTALRKGRAAARAQRWAEQQFREAARRARAWPGRVGRWPRTQASHLSATAARFSRIGLRSEFEAAVMGEVIECLTAAAQAA